MPLIEIKLPNTIAKALNLPVSSPKRQQIKVLKRLLKKACFTEFGQQYLFDEILLSKHPGKKFQELVPVFDYNKIYNEWWHKTLEGVSDVTWPGQVKFFALSSGTSEAASKYIPVTKELLRGNQIIMIKQLLSLRNYEDVPLSSIGRGWLMLGGSTSLQKGATYFSGDLSGITAKKVPFWFQPFYKPGKKIAREKDWNKKIDEIVEQATQWDIGFIVGIPSWLQLCMEKIIERYNVKSIHDIWPNLAFFVHGGVSFEPYKKGFEKLVSRPLVYIETYLASEGFLAYQDRQYPKGMKLNINQHIFFEFVPFDEKNFDAEGNIIENPEAYMIHEIEEGKDYAVLISTAAGAWRYLIGDTVRLVDKERCEIIITGRTKHFLSIVGEHLSVDNMTKAVQRATEEMNLSLPEFTVAGLSSNDKFSHHWYIACDEKVNEEQLGRLIDETLCKINDDYAVERKSALAFTLTVLPESSFFNFMKSKGKVGGQHKFPRVLKGKMLQDWESFLQTAE